MRLVENRSLAYKAELRFVAVPALNNQSETPLLSQRRVFSYERDKGHTVFTSLRSLVSQCPLPLSVTPVLAAANEQAAGEL